MFRFGRTWNIRDILQIGVWHSEDLDRYSKSNTMKQYHSELAPECVRTHHRMWQNSRMWQSQHREWQNSSQSVTELITHEDSIFVYTFIYSYIFTYIYMHILSWDLHSYLFGRQVQVHLQPRWLCDCCLRNHQRHYYPLHVRPESNWSWIQEVGNIQCQGVRR